MGGAAETIAMIERVAIGAAATGEIAETIADVAEVEMTAGAARVVIVVAAEAEAIVEEVEVETVGEIRVGTRTDAAAEVIAIEGKARSRRKAKTTARKRKLV